MSVTRDRYNAIELDSLPDETAARVRALVEEVAADSEGPQGPWRFGARFNRRGRGSAVNWDLYGFGEDAHSGRFLAVVQLREWRKKHRRFANTLKSYFLIGHTTDGRPFAHPVSALVIHHAIRKGKDVVREVQRWIFDAEYEGLLRQGDIALVPVRRAVGDPIPDLDRLIEQSHALEADELRESGSGALYALNPRLRHLPGVHPPLEARGWHRVAVARRAPFHMFVAPGGAR